MALRFIFLITNFIIPVFIVIRGRRLSSKSPKTISGQIWKLTGYMLLPATLIISFLSLFRPTVTQIILTSCVLLMQIIILIFLNISAKKLSEKK